MSMYIWTIVYESGLHENIIAPLSFLVRVSDYVSRPVSEITNISRMDNINVKTTEGSK